MEDGHAQRYVQQVVDAVAGKRLQAAEMLGVNRRTPYRYRIRAELDSP
jgi:DNA-binding protein Fis